MGPTSVTAEEQEEAGEGWTKGEDVEQENRKEERQSMGKRGKRQRKWSDCSEGEDRNSKEREREKWSADVHDGLSFSCF